MTKRVEIFNTIANDYDKWYDENQNLFQSELAAIKTVFPKNKEGIEIGAGTGRFSKALNISIGIEPSKEMAKFAIDRGISIILSYAERLPLPDMCFDFALFVTSICFIKDIKKAFNEVSRILKPSGEIIIGFIDKNGTLGQKYEKQGNGVFKYAQFYSYSDVIGLLEKSGFANFTTYQTLFETDNKTIEQPEVGYGKGSFIVIKGIKS